MAAIVVASSKIFVVGGKVDQINPSIGHQALSSTYEIFKSDIIAYKVNLYKKREMINPRYAFGYCTFNFGKYIIVVGGALSNYDHTDQCEFYDTNLNQWFKMPSLSGKRYSSGVVNFKN